MTIRVTSYRPQPEPVEWPQPEPESQPEPPDEDPRRDWTDLLAAWLVVYDRTKPWRLRRRREARERIKHWLSLLDPPKRRPVDMTLLLSALLWSSIIAIALIGGSR